MKLGLLGGSFNPVHNTHLDVARAVLERLALDRVLLVPAGDPYHKSRENMLPADFRLELVKRAVSSEPFMEASDLDLVTDHPTYTVDTLRRAGKKYSGAELYFLMGQDSYENLARWKDWELLPGLASLVVISRGEEPEALERVTKRLFPEVVQESDGVWRLSSGNRIFLFSDIDFRVSATRVRMMWLDGDDCSELVPSQALDYLYEIQKQVDYYWTVD